MSSNGRRTPMITMPPTITAATAGIEAQRRHQPDTNGDKQGEADDPAHRQLPVILVHRTLDGPRPQVGDDVPDAQTSSTVASTRG